MTLEELKNEVILLTARPDLDDLTLQAVRSATLKMHQREYWRRDLAEVGVQFGTPEYLQSFDVYEFIPKFRSLSYIRKYQSKLLEIIDPGELLNYFGNEKVNVAYMAGNALHIKSSDPITYIQLGYFKHPDTTLAGYDSWIADEFPYAIIYEAVQIVLASIGYLEAINTFAVKAREEFLAMQRTAIIAEGR